MEAQVNLPAYNIVHLPGNTGSHTVVDAEQTRRFSAAALTQIQIINTIENFIRANCITTDRIYVTFVTRRHDDDGVTMYHGSCIIPLRPIQSDVLVGVNDTGATDHIRERQQRT